MQAFILETVNRPGEFARQAQAIATRDINVAAIALEDKPGTAAKTAKKLADAGVNIELFAPVEYTDGKATIAIGVDKVDDARRVLADQLIEWKVPETVHAGMSR